MFKTRKLVLGIILVLLMIITLLIGISIGNKNIIQKQLEKTQKLTATSDENSYITTEDHLAEVNASFSKLTEFKSAIANYIIEAGGVAPESTANTTTFGNSIKNIVTEVTKDATATSADITTGKTAYVNGNKITGTSSGSGNITFTLVADSGSTGGGWRVARYRFDNSKGIYKKIKCTYWSRNDSLIYVSDNLNETQIYGGVEYDLPQANLITISLVDPSITNTEATFVLYVS